MRQKLNEVIFGTSTRAGRNFDLVLLILILLSVFVVMMESVPEWRVKYGDLFHELELGFTAIFTVEYLLRIYISPRPLKYIFSFWGVVDLLSVLPTFITPFLSGYQSLRAIRALRLLRIFRILNLNRFTNESQALYQSLKASYYKIMVFLFFVVLMMIMAGTLMYVIEGGQNGFDSIPASIYWAIVTVTTVGFGDITPQTDIGKLLASLMMILGYAIIAVPTGLISVEMSKIKKGVKSKTACKNCGKENGVGAVYCNECGERLVD